MNTGILMRTILKSRSNIFCNITWNFSNKMLTGRKHCELLIYLQGFK